MNDLLTRLAQIGLRPEFVRGNALPEWWNNTLEDDPTAVMEAAGYIAKRMGLDIYSVLTPDSPITFKQRGNPKFKKRQGTEDQQLQTAQGLVSRVAEIIAYATLPTYKEPLLDPSKIRESILKQRAYVDLAGLLDFCWACGIPVVHFSAFPKDIRKMDGMAICLQGRPVIVISCVRHFAAWLLFVLAHELGHVLLGHVQDYVLVDEAISQEEQDPEEVAANDFAARLLLGDPSKYDWGSKTQPHTLVKRAKSLAMSDRNDPGVICLNYAWRMKDWSVGMAALKSIEPNPDAPATINSYLRSYLDWDRLDQDSQEYLKLVTGA